MNCPACNAEVLDIDVKCSACGAALGATGAHRMIGQTVLSVYELVDVLGQGGMSVVYKARHKMTEQEVALKILPPELAAHSQVKSRFLEEAKALAALDHPNIVHLYNFGQENQSFVLAMQFVSGKTWERMILESKRLYWTQSVKIAIDVLKALEYAHSRGVIHRDMKPSNVLVRNHDSMATVMDFGIAKMTTSTKLTATGQTMGTVRYMSPEQVRGQEVDLRTDIYSLGATMYESLVGDTPFDGSTHFEIMTKHLSEAPKRPSSLGVDLPATVEEALMRSLAKRAADRFETARDMRLVLEAALRDGDVGLSETQRLGGDAVAEVRRNVSTPPLRAASSLADQLEPMPIDVPTAAVRSPRTGSKLPLVVILALLVLGGGAAVYALVLRKTTPDVYKGVAKADGLVLVEGKTYDKLNLLVESDGTIKPDELFSAYATAQRALIDSNKKVFETVNVALAEHIVALPKGYLCSPSLFRTKPPTNCATAAFAAAFGADGKNQLLIANDRPNLGDNMKRAVATAACLFQPETMPAGQVQAICEASKQFTANVEHSPTN
ncbi:MAG: serine/threonine-protein kinase [Kofleriaceae bacterium]